MLKEQSNVSRHHPEWCDLRSANQSMATGASSKTCLDAKPTFVAQSSISLYFLLAGLACYLADLALRKQRRSRSPVHLLASSYDPSGDLLELTLSSNHRRFNNWLPGQFVYLNCPQVSPFEWHPFTISSMDPPGRKFTLHIRTSGDWTRRLNCLLAQSHGPSLSLGDIPSNQKQQHWLWQDNQMPCIFGQYKPDRQSYLLANILAADILAPTSGKLASSSTRPQLLACTTNVHSRDNNNSNRWLCKQEEAGKCRRSDIATCKVQDHPCGQQQQVRGHKLAELYVDGPFHSPFERLLGQQVSVCVASGVGWTAFSSILGNLASCCQLPASSQYFRTTTGCWPLDQFACNDNSNNKSRQRESCSDCESDVVQQHQATTMAGQKCSRLAANSGGSVWQIGGQVQLEEQGQFCQTIGCNLHLLIIVANVNQLRPFYALAKAYFDQQLDSSPLRDISVFLTRCKLPDRITLLNLACRILIHCNNLIILSACLDSEEVENFCKSEQLVETKSEFQNCITVNNLFKIYFGRPQLDAYLQQFRLRYPEMLVNNLAELCHVTRFHKSNPK